MSPHLTARVDAAHGMGDVALRYRQPDEGRGGPGDPVREHHTRATRDDGARRWRGCTRERDRSRGFVAAGAACGIKASGAPDLALLCTHDSVAVPAAAVFTSNKAKAAPVLVSRRHLDSTGGRRGRGGVLERQRQRADRRGRTARRPSACASSLPVGSGLPPRRSSSARRV